MGAWHRVSGCDVAPRELPCGSDRNQGPGAPSSEFFFFRRSSLSLPQFPAPSLSLPCSPSVSLGLAPSVSLGLAPSVSLGLAPSVSLGLAPSVSLGLAPSVSLSLAHSLTSPTLSRSLSSRPPWPLLPRPWAVWLSGDRHEPIFHKFVSPPSLCIEILTFFRAHHC
jgi:hypothetical protein